MKKRDYKDPLAEKLVGRIKQIYSKNGLTGLQQLIDQIHEKYMGVEDENS